MASPYVKEGTDLNSLIQLPFDDDPVEEFSIDDYNRALQVGEEWLKKKNAG